MYLPKPDLPKHSLTVVNKGELDKHYIFSWAQGTWSCHGNTDSEFKGMTVIVLYWVLTANKSLFIDKGHIKSTVNFMVSVTLFLHFHHDVKKELGINDIWDYNNRETENRLNKIAPALRWSFTMSSNVDTNYLIGSLVL